MTAQAQLDANLKAVDAAHSAFRQAADAEHSAQIAFRQQTDRYTREQNAIREADAAANARALAGEDVAATLADNSARQRAVDYFISRTAHELEIEVWKLTTDKLRLDYELQTCILAAEQSRLAVHEQGVARALAVLCEVCANPRLTVGGAISQSEGRNNGDLKGARHAQIIKDQALKVEQAKKSWIDATEHTRNLQRKFLSRKAA